MERWLQYLLREYRQGWPRLVKAIKRILKNFPESAESHTYYSNLSHITCNYASFLASRAGLHLPALARLLPIITKICYQNYGMNANDKLIK